MKDKFHSIIYWILFAVLGWQILNTPQVMIQRGMKDNTAALEAIAAALEKQNQQAPVAQSVERRVEATEAAGSKPAGSTIQTTGTLTIQSSPQPEWATHRLDDIPLEEGSGRLLGVKP